MHKHENKYFCVIDRKGQVHCCITYEAYFLYKESLKGCIEGYYQFPDVAVIGWFTLQQLGHQQQLVCEMWEVHHYLLEMDFTQDEDGGYSHPDIGQGFTEYKALKKAEEMNGRFVPKYSNWRTHTRKNPLQPARDNRKKKLKRDY